MACYYLARSRKTFIVETCVHIPFVNKSHIETEIKKLVSSRGIVRSSLVKDRIKEFGFPGRVISDFFRSIINSNKIVLLSDGSATRTFCYVSDAIEGYLRALLSEENGEAFNIGNSSPEISILELANLIGKVCDSNPIIEYQKSVDKNYLKDNPNRRCPNTSKALNLLSFKAKTDLEEGLRNTWEFYSNNEFQEETGSKQPL